MENPLKHQILHHIERNAHLLQEHRQLKRPIGHSVNPLHLSTRFCVPKIYNLHNPIQGLDRDFSQLWAQISQAKSGIE